jgi:hypothetical protein
MLLLPKVERFSGISGGGKIGREAENSGYPKMVVGLPGFGHNQRREC